MIKIASSLIFSILLCGAVAAQQVSAGVSGRVLDPNGAVIPGATLTAKNIETGLETTVLTDNNGFYSLPNLPAGNYQFRASKTGFSATEKTNIVLHVADVISMNFNLQVGSVTESITVEEGAPIVNTEDSSVSTVVDRQFVSNMPLNGRSFQSLIELTPGVVAAATDYNNQGQFNVNGQRADTNYFTIDGASANVGVGPGGAINTAGSGALPGTAVNGGFNNLISVDAMQEFRIETSTFAPEYGRTPGGQVVIASRSGTNHLHGDIFEYLRNDALDASDWFVDHNHLPKPALRQNDFGGVLGGPIKRDKLFFFLSYEGLRLHQSVYQPTTDVPSLCARGIAPASGPTSCSATGGTSAVAGILPYLNAYPVPNGASTAADPNVALFTGLAPTHNQLDAGSVRVDYQLSQRMTLFGRYDIAPSSIQSQTVGPLYVNENHTKTVTLGDTFVIAPTLVNDLRLNYSHVTAASSGSMSSFGGAVPVPNSVLFPNQQYQPGLGNAGFFFYPFTEMNYLEVGPLGNNRNHQWNVVDSLSFAKSTHQVKFGFDYRQLTPVFTGPNDQYLAEFISSASWNKGIADISEVDNQPGEGYRINNYSFYAQDTWKTSQRLTLTYGLRWEINPGVTSPNNTPPFSLSHFDPNNPSTLSLAPFGTPTFQTRWSNFAPRLGFAYELSARRNWGRVLRGGFGMFYDDASAATGFTFGPWTSARDTFNTPFPTPPGYDLSPPPISLTPPFTAHKQTTVPNLKMPYTYEFNLAVQQALGANQSLSLTYLGALGHDLIRDEKFYGANPVFISPFTVWRNTAFSSYHALQAQFQRRLSHNLQALASYTWSHSLDNASQTVDFSSTSAQIFHIGSYVSNNFGPSDFDIRHTFQAAASYNIPSPARNSWLNAALGHWGVDTIYRVRSAPPANIIWGTKAFSVPGAKATITLRPDVVPGQSLYLFGPQYPGGVSFNMAAFTAPPIDPSTGNPVRQGDLGRNALRGFGSQETDLALRRSFPLTEKYHLDFRTDLFNVFNHPSFATPDGTITDVGLFGLSRSMLAGGLGSGNGSNGGSGGFNPLYQMGGARSIQLSLKLVF